MMKRFYVETGATVSANGAVVSVECVIDGRRGHNQVGPSCETRDEADEWAAALNAIVEDPIR